MKNLKSRSRPTAEEALRAVSQHAPSLPPVQVDAADRPTTLNLRVRTSTLRAIEAEARRRGLTMKQLVTQGLQGLGVAVAAADLEDRTPRRRFD